MNPSRLRRRGRQQKRAQARAQGLQKLAATLIDLSPAMFDRLGLEGALRDAVIEGRSLSRGARARHVRHLANRLEQADAEAVSAALERAQGTGRAETARLHRVERWRERLLEEGDMALSELCLAYPHADRQHLRQLVRSARREREREAPPRHFRELLRCLRDLDESNA